jgi:RNA polymerase sigma factor (sigma-70 family)
VTGLAAVPSIGRAANVETRAEAAGSVTLEALYERHSQRVFRFCLSYLRKRDDAEDAAQTTFLYALRALRRGVVPASETAWLLKIARNVCLTRFDSVRRRGNLELIQDPHVLAETAPARPGGDTDLIGLQAALERLPQRQRQAILLREWQGLSYVEIAEELGLTTSAVETLLFRARRSLARELGGEESRRGLDLQALLGWAKALLGGTAAKLAVGAAVVATVGVVGPIAVHRFRGGEPPAKQPAEVVRQQAYRARSVHAAVAPTRAHVPARSTVQAAASATAKVSTTPAGPTRAAPAHEPAPAPHGTAGPAPGAPVAPAESTGATASTPSLSDPVAIVPVPSLPDPVTTVPSVTVPSVTLTSVTVPSVTVPSVTVPSVTVPSETVPSVPDPPPLPKLP